MSKKNTELMNKIEIIPLVLVIAIIPLIVRAKIVLMDLEVARFWIDTKSLDLFSYNKAVALIIVAIIIIGILLLTLKKEKIYVSKNTKIIGLVLGVFSIFTIVSTIMSDYKKLALWGAPERYEGMFVLLIYILLFFYSIYIFRDLEMTKYIKYAMIFLATSLSVIGISQIIGKDLINSEFFLKLIVPQEYKEFLKNNVTIGKSVYLTLQNPNYVGSYAAIIIPFLASLTISSYEKLYIRVISAVLIGTTLLILIASKAQSGIFALIMTVVFSGLLFAKVVIKKPKILLAICAIVLSALLGANIITKGLLLERTLDIFSEAGQFFKKTESSFDPTYGAYAYDINFEGNKIHLDTKDGKIDITINQDYSLDFTDENGKKIDYSIEPNKGYVLSKPYDRLSMGIAEGKTKIIGYKNGVEAVEKDFPETCIISCDEKILYNILLDTEKGLHLIDNRYNEIQNLEAAHWGFEGKETLGSGRGYIWSRTIPLLKNTIILGNGPDTFLAYFPQNELLAKLAVYNKAGMTTDKAHSMYFQFALNNGIVATVALCVAWGIYFIDSLKLYALKKKYSELDYFGIACFLSFIGYMSAGIFNDSTVLVSPIYWVLFGCGVATNQILRRRKLTNGE